MKRKLSLALALTMTLGSVNTVSAKTFTDTEGSWAQGQIDRWSNYNVLSGYTDGSFKPKSNITRAELASMVDKIMHYQVEGENVYSDVVDGAWYTSSLLKNIAAGNLVNLTGAVNPNENVTRQEVAVFLCNALNIEAVETNTTFADDSLIAEWAKGYVSALQQAGYINGRTGNLYAPTENITRAEVVTILDNIIKALYTSEGTYTNAVDGTVVVNTEDVVLKDTSIAGDLVIAAGVGEGDLTLDNVVVEGEIIVEGGGSHSVKLTNGTKATKIKMQKNSKETVRLFIDENSAVTNVETSGKSGILLEGNGGFGDVTLVGTNSVTIAESVVIDKLEITEGGTVQNNGTITEVVVAETAKETVIDGKGKITVVISDNGLLSLFNAVEKLIISNPNAQVKVSENVAKILDKLGSEIKEKVTVENKGNGNANGNANANNSNSNSSNNSNNNSNSSNNDVDEDDDEDEEVTEVVNNAPKNKYGTNNIGRSLANGSVELHDLGTVFSDVDGDKLTYYFMTVNTAGEKTYSAADVTLNSIIKTSNTATFKIENGVLKADNAKDGTYTFTIVAFDGKAYSNPTKYIAELYGSRQNITVGTGSKINLENYFGATPSVEIFVSSNVYNEVSQICTVEGSYVYINEVLKEGAGQLLIYDKNSDKVLVVSLVTADAPTPLITSASAIVVKGQKNSIDATGWFSPSATNIIRLYTSKYSDEIDYPSTGGVDESVFVNFMADDLTNAVSGKVYEFKISAVYYNTGTSSVVSKQSNPISLFVTVQ